MLTFIKNNPLFSLACALVLAFMMYLLLGMGNGGNDEGAKEEPRPKPPVQPSKKAIPNTSNPKEALSDLVEQAASKYAFNN